jgi:zeta-carotene isomerase
VDVKAGVLFSIGLVLDSGKLQDAQPYIFMSKIGAVGYPEYDMKFASPLLYCFLPFSGAFVPSFFRLTPVKPSTLQIGRHSDVSSCGEDLPRRTRRNVVFSSGLSWLSASSSSNRLQETEVPSGGLVGDDSAYFDLKEQSLKEWLYFSVATFVVLAFIAWLWVLPDGPHGGDAFLQLTQSLVGTTDPAVTVATMLASFAAAHSGLAGIRTYAEPVVGARAWRVLFAFVSLPLALSCVSYFVNHAHEGQHLWEWHDTQLAHSLLWITNFVSFLFLYPSTFNLLEIAAIQPPQLHLWETGVIRITRHPQAFGQFLWCFAHTLYLGTSTAVAASAMLLLHHAFACYHGDRRLQARHGEDFEYIKSKTSIVPFQAIIEGRQQLPPDYYREWLRGPYLFVVAGTTAAYFAHPYMQAGAALLHW